MNDQNSLEQGLQTLRLVAERGDWNSSRDATEALLLHLPTSHAVRLTRDFVARRLTAFERHEPGVRWPRDLLEVVTEEGSASSERSWSFGDNFPGPGSANFGNAVESLWIANLRREDARQCVAELVDALSGAIMAEGTEHWGARHPKEWALWYQLAWSGDNDRRKTEIVIAMARDPDAKRLERAGWLEVADQLEAALRESAGSSGGSERHT